MSKPAARNADALIRGQEGRFAAPALSAMIVEYEGDRSAPETVVALVEALRPHEALGLRVGDRVRVGMSVHPDDRNAVVADLEKGGLRSDEPACAPGSVVEFEGCTKRGDEDVVEASRFRVVEAVPYPRAVASDPRTTRSLPEVGDVITGFVVFTGGSPREARLAGLHVVEGVAKRPDGYGHGAHDVYPGGHGITARRLREDGTYDPNGALAMPLMGAERSAGNNHQFLVVGRLPSWGRVEAPVDEPDEPGCAFRP